MNFHYGFCWLGDMNTDDIEKLFPNEHAASRVLEEPDEGNIAACSLQSLQQGLIDSAM